MNIKEQKEFLTSIYNISRFAQDSEKEMAIKKMQLEIMDSLSSNLPDMMNNQDIDFNESSIDDFVKICEEMEIEPVDVIKEFLQHSFSNHKTFNFEGHDISLEGIHEFFEKSQENFLKEKDENNINNF